MKILILCLLKVNQFNEESLFQCQDIPSSKIKVEGTLEVEKSYKFLFGGIEKETKENEKK